MIFLLTSLLLLHLSLLLPLLFLHRPSPRLLHRVSSHHHSALTTHPRKHDARLLSSSKHRLPPPIEIIIILINGHHHLLPHLFFFLSLSPLFTLTCSHRLSCHPSCPQTLLSLLFFPLFLCQRPNKQKTIYLTPSSTSPLLFEETHTFTPQTATKARSFDHHLHHHQLLCLSRSFRRSLHENQEKSWRKKR